MTAGNIAIRYCGGSPSANPSGISARVVAAWLAFTITHDWLGHPTPFFAPVAAWICLGFTYNRVPRKVAEIGAGAAIGVGIGELILYGFGAGAWQLATGLLIGGLMGRLLDRGDLFTIQCGVNAMIVVGMGTMPTNEVGACLLYTSRCV